jgi:hypothetical protein
MVKNYLFIIVCALSFFSCTKENVLPSALSIKSVSLKADTGSSDTEEMNVRSSDTETVLVENDTILWCNGTDIEWYNATTEELKISDKLYVPSMWWRLEGGTLVIFLYDKKLLSFPIPNPISSKYPTYPCIETYLEIISPEPSGEPDRIVMPGDAPPAKGECKWHYYIRKGYPEAKNPNWTEAQANYWASQDAEKEKRWKAIEREWNIFIEQLKKEGKYRE